MNSLLVSIITPSYNQAPFIRSTIESVLNQDYPNLEYIIMDGGSTDNTASIAQEFAGRLRFISERDRGQAHAINKGFRLAKGEVVAWLNSDDLILPGAVSHAARAFERMPTLGAVFGEGYLIDRDGNVKSRFPPTEHFNLWKLIYLWDPILQQTVYFRRSVVEEVGFLDESLNWGLDWEFLIRIGKRYPIEYIPEYMGCLREYEDAKTFSGGYRRFRELAAIMRRHSGVRYPPGYFVYGLETYQNIICRYIPFHSLRKIISNAAYRGIAYVIRECQGLYPDGWAGAYVQYMLPPGKGGIRITGFIPDHEALHGQSLEIICDGAMAARCELQAGEFLIDVACERDETEVPVYIEIKASKLFVPSQVGMTEDNRRLAYMLRTIEWAERPPPKLGIYEDGWTSDYVRYTLPAGNGRIRIKGFLPDITSLRGQILEVICNGLPVARDELQAGEFQIEFACQEQDPASPIHLEIKASKAMMPSKIGMNADTRKLAYMLRGIDWVDGAPVARSAL
jgi:glycosyltransferase involved in cell wall biosynthesis